MTDFKSPDMTGGTLTGLLVTLILTTAILLHFYDRFWYPPDEGVYAHAAERVLNGEILNLDIQDIHFGYITQINATALHLFGHNLVSLRYPLVLIGLLQATLI